MREDQSIRNFFRVEEARNPELRTCTAPAVTIPALGNDDTSDWHFNGKNFFLSLAPLYPKPPRDAFQDHPAHSPRNDTTAFVLTDRITHGNARVGQITRIYNLPKLRNAVLDYYEQQLEDSSQLI